MILSFAFEPVLLRDQVTVACTKMRRANGASKYSLNNKTIT